MPSILAVDSSKALHPVKIGRRSHRSYNRELSRTPSSTTSSSCSRYYSTEKNSKLSVTMKRKYSPDDKVESSHSPRGDNENSKTFPPSEGLDPIAAPKIAALSSSSRFCDIDRLEISDRPPKRPRKDHKASRSPSYSYGSSDSHDRDRKRSRSPSFDRYHHRRENRASRRSVSYSANDRKSRRTRSPSSSPSSSRRKGRDSSPPDHKKLIQTTEIILARNPHYSDLPIEWWDRAEDCREAKTRHVEKIDALCSSREQLVLDTTLWKEDPALEPNMFPYQTPPGVVHYTLWSRKELSKAEVVQFVDQWLSENFPHVRRWQYDDNLGERSIELFHVHVFVEMIPFSFTPEPGKEYLPPHLDE